MPSQNSQDAGRAVEVPGGMGPGLFFQGVTDPTQLLIRLRAIVIEVFRINNYNLRRNSELAYSPFVDDRPVDVRTPSRPRTQSEPGTPCITINVSRPVRATIRGYITDTVPGIVFTLESIEFSIGAGGVGEIFDTLTQERAPQIGPGRQMRVAGAAIGTPVARDSQAEQQMAMQLHNAGMISQETLMERLGITIDENQVRHIDMQAERTHDTTPEQLEAIEERRRLAEAEQTFGRSLRAIDIEMD